jgi:hypothetical protein
MEVNCRGLGQYSKVWNQRDLGGPPISARQVERCGLMITREGTKSGV